MYIAKDPTGNVGDQQFEQVLGTLLICGVIAAAAMVLLGGVVYLARHGAAVADYHRFQGNYHSLSVIIRDVLAAGGG